MKKIFIEPEMHVIELNFSENIATSGETPPGGSLLIHVSVDSEYSCQVTGTAMIWEIYMDASGKLKQIATSNGCYIYGTAAATYGRGYGKYIPAEDVKYSR